MKNDVVSPQFDENSRALRCIRSFVRRQGRLTRGQQYAIDQFWPVMGVEYQSETVTIESLFGRQAYTVLEIGFGTGTSLVTMAQQHPDFNFIGIEVHLPGVGACLAAAHQAGIKNLRVICHDAVEVLETMIPDASLDSVQLFFPDPWHKIRHNKRRIVQKPFVERVARKLKMGGVLHMATDWQAYAEHMLEVMGSVAAYANLAADGQYVPRPESRQVTKFEKRGQRLGHGIWDLMFNRKH